MVKLNFRQDGRLDGGTNMDRDAALLADAENGDAGCRVYEWAGPWASLGKQQVAVRDLLDPCLVPWVMRPTGGRAVLHGHDVTVGLALPISAVSASIGDPSRVTRSVKAAYRLLIRPLVGALRDCGVHAVLAEEMPSLAKEMRSADCFAQVSPNDVVIAATGQKACGCALRLTAGGVLLQASIPAGPPLIDPSVLFAGAHDARYSQWQTSLFPECLHDRLLDLLEKRTESGRR